MESEWNIVGALVRDTYIERQIGRVNRNLLLMSLGLILAVAAYGAGNWRYFYNFFAGPVDLNADSLGKIGNPDSQLRYFVRVAGTELDDVGLQDVEQQVSQSGSVQSESVKAEYAVMAVQNRLLVVKKPPKTSNTTLQGEISLLPANLHAKIVAPLLQDYPNADHVFLPLMLDSTGFRNEGYIALAICIPVLLFALWNIRKVIQRQRDPLTHPIVKTVSRYGPFVETARRIDDELKGDASRLSRAAITPSWIVLPSMFALAVCHIPDVVWAYKKVTSHSVNFIPTGKTYTAIVFDRHAVSLELPAKQEKVDSILAMLAAKAPWALFGYSDELKKSIEADWNALLAAVDAKHSEYERGVASLV